ncbi:MAG: hypothetical protein M0R03_15955 [Novosphingobium sp.]|nr:hypothetical protein [Novosphingobium sp.]
MKSELTLKIERDLLIYYRFGKSYLICNEVTLKYGICDLFAIKRNTSKIFDNKYLTYEFEIKISKNDFQNELRSKNKTKKHKYYSSGISAPNKPNYFYFVTIPELKDFAISFISKLNKSYGLIIYDESVLSPYNRFSVVSNAKRLCKIGNCDMKLIWNLLSRSTSAYCGIIKKEQN